MPALDAEHNHFSINQRPHLSSTSAEDTADYSRTDPALPVLPATTYTTPTKRKPSLTSTSQQTTPTPLTNGPVKNVAEDDEADPHDFYRTHQDTFGVMAGLGQGDIRVEKRGQRITNNPEDVSETPNQSNGIKAPPVMSRLNNARYGSSSGSAERNHLNAARSSPTLSSAAKKRQTSVRELANRFNETTDEVPPVPSKGRSRSPSLGPVAGRQTSTVRASSRSRRPDEKRQNIGFSPAEMSLLRPSGSPKSHQRRGRHEDRAVSPITNQDVSSHSDALGSDRLPALQPHIDSSTEVTSIRRRPLFGEVLRNHSSDHITGYGIPPPRRRQSSNSSMHKPNPMFPESGVIGDKDGVQDETHDEGNRAGNGILAPTTYDIQNNGMGASLYPSTAQRPTADLSGSSSPTFQDQFPRNSQSRIPVSTRRMSVTSDSGISSVLSRHNSGLNHLGTRAPPPSTPSRTRAPPPQPLQNTRSPPHYLASDVSARSPHGRDRSGNAQPLATSPRLNAYISAPAPRVSPTLRSSRPRQHVSSATTSASRAKVVDKHCGNDRATVNHKRDQKPRRPPELAGVDIAARKQAITRSYTQKVGERERKVEEMNLRRASLLRSEGLLAHGVEKGKEHTQDPPVPQGQVNGASSEGQGEETPQVQEDQPKPEGDLSINIGHLADRSVLDLSMEDSPTLGNFNRFPLSRPPNQRRPTHASSISDFEPLSALTTGTSDSLDTFFDDEPQEDSVNNSRSQSRDELALSQIIDMARSQSPSPTTARTACEDVDGSDKDDRESIQIILGATPVLERAPNGGASFSETPNDIQPKEDPNSRWSLTSHESIDALQDPFGAASEVPKSQETQTPNHLSISTATTDQHLNAWSPSTPGSPKTARTTMDSDAYSTINRVLEHYHDSNAVSPQMVQDVRHLIKKGGWDPKKVTQLYLQQSLAERGSTPNTQITHQDPFQAQTQVPSLSIAVPPAAAEKEIRDDVDEKIVEDLARLRSQSIASSNALLDDGDLKSPRASLNRPEDWKMSPSLGGYHQQALDSPLTEARPSLPPKDWTSLNSKLADNRLVSSPQSAKPRLPEIGGLDLEIKVEPPVNVNHANSTPGAPAELPPQIPFTLPFQNQASPLPPPSRSPPQPNENDKGNASVSRLNRNVDEEIISPRTVETNRSIPTMPPAPQPSSASIKSQGVVGDALSGTTEVASKTSSPTLEQKRLKKRTHVIKELVDTEHSFCQDMKVVDDIYKGTSNVIMVSPEEIKTLFGNSDQIVAFSTNFLDSLKQASKPVYVLAKEKRWKSNRVSSTTTYSGTTDDQSSINGPELTDDEKDRKTFIGEVFKHHLINMEKVYAEYLKNHDAATQKLQVLQKNPKVQIWLKECRAYATDLTAAWDLDSLLVKPVQRLLKYPLLLEALLEATPENHPDWPNIDNVIREIKCISQRINESKKRAELFQTANNVNFRKRKESDVRITFPRAFGRKTEKLRQQVGLSDMVEDKQYAAVHTKFGTHFFQIQVVMRDVEMYVNDVQRFTNSFCEFALAMEAHVDVAQTSYPEVESKWRKFRMSMSELATIALADHVASVRKHVIEPLVQLWNLHAGPQKYMDKRNKRLMDYARYKAVKERGDRPDKKVVENAELFMAVNDTLKEELPKLFSLTGKLVEACLNNFIQLQVQWQRLLRRRMSQALDDAEIPRNGKEIIEAFTEDFAFFDNQVVSLSICNGSMINETPNLLSTPNAMTGEDMMSGRPGSTLDLKRRTMSVSSDRSPQLPQPDFGTRDNGGFFTVSDASHLTSSIHREPSRRMRASSTLSGHSPRTPDAPRAYRTCSSNTTPVVSTPGRTGNSGMRHNTEPTSSLRPSMETPRANRMSDDSGLTNNRYSGTTFHSNSQAPPESPTSRHSGVFSSAMPMSDSPRSQSPTSMLAQQPEFNVIFLAASLYEFNIDRARKEAGYPYLTYGAGEVSLEDVLRLFFDDLTLCIDLRRPR